MSETIGTDAAETEALVAFRSMIHDAAVSPASITVLLDGLADDARGRVVRGLTSKDQRALYGKVAGYAPLGLIDLVSSEKTDLEEVRHLGRNTLPAFRNFEKRFCRLPGVSAAAPETLAGYNFQPFSAVTGPGYFLAAEDTNAREVLVDYRHLPDEKPMTWPEIRSNESGLSRFVYGFMVDRLRRVSEQVTIGSAARKGRDLGSYFILCRVD
ncbi:MAG: hypothetical protein VCB25_08365 [Myxococcota bacterium]